MISPRLGISATPCTWAGGDVFGDTSSFLSNHGGTQGAPTRRPGLPGQEAAAGAESGAPPPEDGFSGLRHPRLLHQPSPPSSRMPSPCLSSTRRPTTASWWASSALTAALPAHRWPLRHSEGLCCLGYFSGLRCSGFDGSANLSKEFFLTVVWSPWKSDPNLRSRMARVGQWVGASSLPQH